MDRVCVLQVQVVGRGWPLGSQWWGGCCMVRGGPKFLQICCCCCPCRTHIIPWKSILHHHHIKSCLQLWESSCPHLDTTVAEAPPPLKDWVGVTLWETTNIWGYVSVALVKRGHPKWCGYVSQTWYQETTSDPPPPLLHPPGLNTFLPLVHQNILQQQQHPRIIGRWVHVQHSILEACERSCSDMSVSTDWQGKGGFFFSPSCRTCVLYCAVDVIGIFPWWETRVVGGLRQPCRLFWL